MPNRVTFLIDGFNLYHSARDASDALKLNRKGTKWLNIRSVCESFLPQISGDAILCEVHYFSALATHIEARHPDVTTRHRLFISCLENTGVIPHLGRFQKGPIKCKHCKKIFARYEEKETDVAIASALLESVAMNKCDTVLIMTGDTDLAPALRAAKRVDPKKVIGFIFPYKRKNKALARLADLSYNLRPETYREHQFDKEVTLRSGIVLIKPDEW